nr:zinc-type alcohol dehydrogenase-like protein c16a3.02c [Quercus suber]
MATSLPASMRAATWSNPSKGLDRSLTVNSSTPLPKNAQSLPKESALVKVAYVSLNPVDYKLIENPILRLALGSRTPCSDFSGTVIASTMPHLKPGDRVAGAIAPPAFGAAAEYVIATGKNTCVPLPNGCPLEQAVCIGVAGLTAYQCIAPNVKAGDKVLINGGSGGTGSFGIQIAKALGCHVTTTCSGANVELCKSLGADEVIDYRSEPVLPALKRKGTQFDLVVDNVFADPAIYYECHEFLKAGKPFVTIAGDFTLSAMRTLITALLLPAVLGGGKRPLRFLSMASDSDGYGRLVQWMAEGKVKAVIEKEFSGLEELGDAFARMKSGRTRAFYHQAHDVHQRVSPGLRRSEEDKVDQSRGLTDRHLGSNAWCEASFAWLAVDVSPARMVVTNVPVATIVDYLAVD